MALFSRRGKRSKGESAPAVDAAAAPPVPPAPPVEEPSARADAATAASVGITVSAFRGAGAPPVAPAPAVPAPRTAAPAVPAAGPARTRAMPPAEAPVPAQSVPGLRDNVLLRDALAALSVEPTPAEQLNVARQLMQSHVLLRVQGDARTLLSESKPLPLATTIIGERRFVLGYSSGAAVQASYLIDHDANTSVMGQPVLAVMRSVIDGGFDGIILDPASAPARVMLSRDLIERALAAAREPLAVKTLLAEPRSAQTSVRVATALLDAPLWVAVAQAPGVDGGPPRMGVAEARTPDGRRLLEIFSHPLEVVALGRQDRPLPFTAAQLARALRGQPELNGVIVDPGGPWIELSRDDLAPVLALEPID